MQIEVGDKLWFGHIDDGYSNSKVVDHIILAEDERKLIKKALKEAKIEVANFDALIFLKKAEGRL